MESKLRKNFKRINGKILVGGNNMAKSKRKTLGKGPFAKRKRGIRRGTGR